MQNTDIHWKNETAITAAPKEEEGLANLFPIAKYKLFKSADTNTNFKV